MGVILELKNVNKTYKYPVLAGFNYQFHQTGLYAIYGISGSGKSTLLNLIAGFEKPDSGEIKANFKHIEYVMQDHMLLSNITVKDNLYLKLNLTEIKVSEYDNLIQDVCSKLSIGHIIENKVSVLSGGEKQRVSLARALLNVPKVILLDEPTASIDHSLKKNLLDLLLDLSKDRLIIITTHDPLVKEYANHMLYLERGNLNE